MSWAAEASVKIRCRCVRTAAILKIVLPAIDIRFRGFPVTPLETQAFFSVLPPDLRPARQRGRTGPWMRVFLAAPTPPARPFATMNLESAFLMI
jgi:hypothetical protein